MKQTSWIYAMKHLYIILLCMTAVFGAGAANGLTYEFNSDGSCTLVSADCEGAVIVPASVVHDGTAYTVTAIGAGAFTDSRLTSLTLPATVVSIGEDAFRRCNYLERVSVPSVDAWLGITFANEYASPLSGYHPLYIGEAPLTDLVLPDGVTSLKPYSFFNCSSLERVDLGGVTEIGAHAFDGCESLSSVTLTAGLRTIGDWAFNICRELPQISIPAGVEYLGQGAFYGCSSLADISLPEGVQVIPALCFAGCISLDTLDFLPASVIGVGDYAFYFCTGLRTARFLESVRYFGDYLFYDCESLESASIPCGGAQLGEFMFADCYALKSVSLPDAITAIPQGFFFECHSLESVEIPQTVVDIADYAFGDCHTLRYISFPQGLRHIGSRAMYGCWTLTRLEFPASMEQIDAEAFYVCSGLKQIHVHSVNPFNISFFSFDWQADREAQVYVPAVSLELYRNDSFRWANFDHLIGLEEYNPDTMLDIRWGDAAVTRTVAYGAEITMSVLRSDGSNPSGVSFNGTPLAVTPDGTVTTPPVTGPSTLIID